MPRKPSATITPAMQRVLNLIRVNHSRGLGTPLQDISAEMNWRATSTAAGVVKRLKKAKLIRKGRGRSNLVPIDPPSSRSAP